MFFTFFKLYKWYQIAQRITCLIKSENNFLWLVLANICSKWRLKILEKILGSLRKSRIPVFNRIMSPLNYCQKLSFCRISKFFIAYAVSKGDNDLKNVFRSSKSQLFPFWKIMSFVLLRDFKVFLLIVANGLRQKPENIFYKKKLLEIFLSIYLYLSIDSIQRTASLRY